MNDDGYGKDYEVSYIVSTNFRANLDAQNAGNCISGLQISNIFWRSMPPDPPQPRSQARAIRKINWEEI
jgi:hypothetical protein